MMILQSRGKEKTTGLREDIRNSLPKLSVVTEVPVTGRSLVDQIVAKLVRPFRWKDL